MPNAVLFVLSKSRKVDVTVKIETDTENNNEISQRLIGNKQHTINYIMLANISSSFI